MHPGEAVGVVGAEPVLQVRHVRVLAGPLDRRDVLGGVHGGQQRIVGDRRRHHLEQVEHAELAGQPHRQLDPDRAHRMAAPEVVRRQILVVHQPAVTAHTMTLSPATVRDPAEMWPVTR
jgi:hypothetical protein